MLKFGAELDRTSNFKGLKSSMSKMENNCHSHFAMFLENTLLRVA